MPSPLLLSINWNPDPELFKLFGSIPIRYYGLLWVVGIGLAYLVVRQQYRDKKIGDDKFEPLLLLLLLRHTRRGAVGHRPFYQPDYYLNHFWEMILPVHFLPGGGWKWTGYEGLASHGGTLGLIIALWLYCRKTKMHYMDVVDMIAVATPVTACCIRLANLMNSKIIGKPTDVPWAFVFERVDMLPRHPAQLYEAIAYFIFFLGMIYLYKQGRIKQSEKPQTDFSKAAAGKATAGIAATSRHHRGFFFGLCLTEIFVFRFFIEFLKENQVNFEDGMTLNMGQWLSVPFIVIGVYFMFFYGKKKG